MSPERYVQRRQELARAAARLAEAAALPPSAIVRDALIQRFEFTFELAWKTLKLYLEQQGHELGGPRPVLKKAFVDGLIPTQEEADIWLRMLEDRNQTSHTYLEPLAERIGAAIIQEYSPLLSVLSERLQSRPWE
ncbi:MAG: nucleotidyltransferase substrate binding protein [Lentisphaeria bacterium]